jgi:thiamine-phosphate diphosphorylase
VRLPRLHVITDDAVLGRPGFLHGARSLMTAHGSAIAVHLRGHRTSGAEIFGLADALVGMAAETGALLLANDRVDVALAAGCGAQLGRRSVPVDRARELLGPEPVMGYSAHDGAAAIAAMAAGADFVLLGTIWPSPSHPGAETAGAELVRAVAAATAAPVIAIGGVTPERGAEALEAGAHGVAVLSGAWGARDPVAATAEYLEWMGVVQ